MPTEDHEEYVELEMSSGKGFAAGERVKITGKRPAAGDAKSAVCVVRMWKPDRRVMKVRLECEAATADAINEFKFSVVSQGATVESLVAEGGRAVIVKEQAEWHCDQKWAAPHKYLGRKVWVHVQKDDDEDGVS